MARPFSPPWARRSSFWNPTRAQRRQAKAALHSRVNATVVVGPLDSGAADLGPFDLIVVEGAFGVFPHSLIALLADPGRLVGIDASSGQSQAVVYEKNGGAISRRALFETKADLLDGFSAGAELRLLNVQQDFTKRMQPVSGVSCLRRLAEKLALLRWTDAASVARRRSLAPMMFGRGRFREQAGGGGVWFVSRSRL